MFDRQLEEFIDECLCSLRMFDIMFDDDLKASLNMSKGMIGKLKNNESKLQTLSGWYDDVLKTTYKDAIVGYVTMVGDDEVINDGWLNDPEKPIIFKLSNRNKKIHVNFTTIYNSIDLAATVIMAKGDEEKLSKLKESYYSNDNGDFFDYIMERDQKWETLKSVQPRLFYRLINLIEGIASNYNERNPDKPYDCISLDEVMVEMQDIANINDISTSFNKLDSGSSEMIMSLISKVTGQEITSLADLPSSVTDLMGGNFDIDTIIKAVMGAYNGKDEVAIYQE